MLDEPLDKFSKDVKRQSAAHQRVFDDMLSAARNFRPIHVIASCYLAGLADVCGALVACFGHLSHL